MFLIFHRLTVPATNRFSDDSLNTMKKSFPLRMANTF